MGNENILTQRKELIWIRKGFKEVFEKGLEFSTLVVVSVVLHKCGIFRRKL